MTKDTASYREVVNAIRESREESKEDNKALQVQFEEKLLSFEQKMDLRFTALSKEISSVKTYIDGNYVLKSEFTPVENQVAGFRNIIILGAGTIFTSLIGAGVAIFTNFLKR